MWGRGWGAGCVAGEDGSGDVGSATWKLGRERGTSARLNLLRKQGVSLRVTFSAVLDLRFSFLGAMENVTHSWVSGSNHILYQLGRGLETLLIMSPEFRREASNSYRT